MTAPKDTTAQAWADLRAPFPPDQVERLPKTLRKDDQDKGRCEQARAGVCADDHPCGGWHARAIHLSYIGHAGVTMRLNDVDPTWNWEPMATTPEGLPLTTPEGLWIKLTVLGVTRLGFGDAPGKRGGDAVKEVIGDALRNAAMRFGVGTYLWSKSEAAQVIAAGGDPDTSRVEEPRNGHPERTPPTDDPAADEARVQLREFCNERGEDLNAIAQEFIGRYGVPIPTATVEQIGDFADVLQKRPVPA